MLRYVGVLSPWAAFVFLSLNAVSRGIARAETGRPNAAVRDTGRWLVGVRSSLLSSHYSDDLIIEFLNSAKECWCRGLQICNVAVSLATVGSRYSARHDHGRDLPT